VQACRSLIAVRLFLAAALHAQTAAPQPVAPESLNSVLWVQTSVEHDAAYLQAFRIARLMLDRARAERTWTAAIEQTASYERLPPAIILDIDETILDNSPEEAQKVRSGSTTSLWKDWVRKERSTALPGALEFTQYADSHDVTVFYVTNRDAQDKPATRRNLAQLGFPLNTHIDPILCRGEKPDWGSDKGSRRAAIAAHYRVLLLVGDDLNDFLSGVHTGPDERRRQVAAYADRWGERWIMLPNPMYGSWEAALYSHKGELSHQEQVQQKHGHLRVIDP
jgi:5'-nucleotidase (lipoprotein e(P4) family)